MVNINNVSYCYDEKGYNGLHDISLHIQKGECVLLCGESGCGKTTVTRLVNGLIPHFYEGNLFGFVSIAGKDTGTTRPDVLASFVGSVFQNPRSQFFNVDTTGEIAFGCENIGLPSAQIAERVENTVAVLDISHLNDRDIFSLSGGEKQLIAIASVYALNPHIFVLDEPSSNLDTNASIKLANLLKKLKTMGKTIIIAEHRLDYLRDIIDRVIYMEKGCITYEWKAKDFLQLSDEKRISLGLRTLYLKTLHFNANNSTSILNKKDTRLQVSNLSAEYKHRKDVLKKVSFTATSGEIIGIIGKNGHGKSTLARVMCGLHKESGGSISINGKPLIPSNRLGAFYLVMQDSNYQLFTDSVESELRLSKNRKDRPSDEKVEKIINSLSLLDFRDRHPMSLSGGQKQRTAIGVSMSHNADVLIFDEPTSGLDLGNMYKVCKIIKNLQAQGKIIFVITHDYELLLSSCTRIIELEDGNVTYDEQLNENEVLAKWSQ